MTDSLPPAAPGATSGESELARLRRVNRGKGLTIGLSSIGGYKYKITCGPATPRFVTDAADAQRVIDEEFS